MRSAQEILRHAVDAHGGPELWASVTSLRIDVSIGGPALALKGRSPRAQRVVADLDPRAVRADLDLAEGGGRFRLVGRTVERIDGAGHAQESRTIPRHDDGRPRVRLAWDRLDVAFFLGYAIWNYALTPWLLTREGFEADALEPASLRGRRCERVRVRFPTEVPTHSPVQDFWFGEDGRLARLDYTAHALASWARGAHEVDEYATFDGVLFPSRRRVWLRPFGGSRAVRVLPAVAGTVHDVVLTRGGE
ncbi:MAG: hypothetical protein AAF957_14400 [Planctomycetota bacterium]